MLLNRTYKERGVEALAQSLRELREHNQPGLIGAIQREKLLAEWPDLPQHRSAIRRVLLEDASCSPQLCSLVSGYDFLYAIRTELLAEVPHLSIRILGAEEAFLSCLDAVEYMQWLVDLSELPSAKRDLHALSPDLNHAPFLANAQVGSLVEGLGGLRQLLAGFTKTPVPAQMSKRDRFLMAYTALSHASYWHNLNETVQCISANIYSPELEDGQLRCRFAEPDIERMYRYVTERRRHSIEVDALAAKLPAESRAVITDESPAGAAYLRLGLQYNLTQRNRAGVSVEEIANVIQASLVCCGNLREELRTKLRKAGQVPSRGLVQVLGLKQFIRIVAAITGYAHEVVRTVLEVALIPVMGDPGPNLMNFPLFLLGQQVLIPSQLTRYAAIDQTTDLAAERLGIRKNGEWLEDQLEEWFRLRGFTVARVKQKKDRPETDLIAIAGCHMIVLEAKAHGRIPSGALRQLRTQADVLDQAADQLDVRMAYLRNVNSRSEFLRTIGMEDRTDWRLYGAIVTATPYASGLKRHSRRFPGLSYPITDALFIRDLLLLNGVCEYRPENPISSAFRKLPSYSALELAGHFDAYIRNQLDNIRFSNPPYAAVRYGSRLLITPINMD